VQEVRLLGEDGVVLRDELVADLERGNEGEKEEGFQG